MRSGKDAIKVCRRFFLHKINKNMQNGAKFRAHLPFNASLFRLYAGKLSLRAFWWSSNVFFFESLIVCFIGWRWVTFAKLRPHFRLLLDKTEILKYLHSLFELYSSWGLSFVNLRDTEIRIYLTHFRPMFHL